MLGYIADVGSSHRVILEDLDGDGDVDAAVASISSNYVGEISIYLNYGNATFAHLATYEMTTGGAYLNHIHMEMGDVNGDGLRDIFFVSGRADSVLLANGDGSFSAGDNLFDMEISQTVPLPSLPYRKSVKLSPFPPLYRKSVKQISQAVPLPFLRNA